MENQRRLSDLIRTGVSHISADHPVTSSRAWLEVGDVMSREVTVVSPDATVLSAAQTMSEKNVSCIVVADDRQVVGILTETDFLTRIAGKDRDFYEIPVGQIMSSPVETIAPDLSVIEASKLMAENRVKRLPIVAEGRLVGIITQTDLVRALISCGMWRDVAEIMTSDVAGIQRQSRVVEAAEVMGSRNISCILALEEGKPVGVLTKKDILKRVVAQGLDPSRITLEEVMSAPVIEIPAHCSVFSASRMMAEKDVRRLVVAEHGRLCGIVAETDIFRAVKDKLQGEEAENLALLEKSDSSIFTVDSDGNTTYVNPAFLKLFEVSDPEELVGEPFLPERLWLNPEDRVPFLRELEKGATSVKELALKTCRGRGIYVTLFFTFTKNAQGEINGSQGMLYDITEKRELATLRRAEQALRESERRYRLLAENAKDVIWTSDLNLQWTYVSPSVVLLLGFTAAEATGQTISEILTPDSAELAQRILKRQLALAKEHGDAATRTWTMELEFTRKDGSTVWTEAKVSFLCGEADDAVGLVGVIRDVTERKRAERELKQYAAALESANNALHDFCKVAESATKAKSEFLASMSHEIRTPMTAVLGFADVLADSLETPEDTEAIETIKRNGQYLLKIIDDILDLSRIETGKLQMERLPCSPWRIVEEVVSLMKTRADSKGLSLKVAYGGRIPTVITTDPIRLKQILINLVGNAVKFTQSGTVRILTQLVRSALDGPKLRFDVIDTGIGMTKGQARKLFKPFVQADASTTRRFGGSGLGLTISKRMAGLLGGDITVDTTPGKGSTFSVTVATGPLDGVALVDPSTKHPPAREQPVESTATQEVKLNCRILLAEDGPDNQRLISLLLKKAGAHVTVVQNGREVLEKTSLRKPGPEPGSRHDNAAEPFDVILMDIQMPLMDGYEAARQLRDAGYRGPIIALTAHAMTGDREKCIDAGCDDYLTKPIDRKKLVQMVAQYVQGPEQKAEAEVGSSSE